MQPFTFSGFGARLPQDDDEDRRRFAEQLAQQQKGKPSGAKRLGVNLAAFLAETGIGIGAAALTPATGGLSLAGGFAAGAGIEALRRKALGEEQNLGASALEGGLTILPGVGKGVKALRGAAALGKAAKAADVAGDVRAGVNLTKAAKPNMAMSALAKKASQETYERGAAQVAARPAAKGFTSSLDAQRFTSFDDFYKNYGAWFKDQGFSKGDAQAVFKSAQKTPIGGTSTAVGGTVGTRPAASIQSQIEAAHAAGKTGEVQKLIGQLPKQDQAAMRSAMGLGGTRATVDASGKIVMKPAATTAATAKETAPSVKQLLKEGFQPKTTGFTTSKLKRGSEALRAQARGVQPGLRPQGSPARIGVEQAGDINQTLNQVGAKGSIGSQLRTVETAQKKALTGIDDALTRSNRAVDQNMLNGVRDKTMQQLTGQGGVIGMTDAHRQLANEVSTRMFQSKDLRGLEQVRRAIDSRINFARNAASPDPVGEEVLKVFRRNIDDAITAAAPDLKQAKTLYSSLQRAKDALIVNAPGAVGVRQQMGAGITGRLLGSAPAQAGLDVAGRGLGRAAQVTGSPITRTFLQQQVGRTFLKPPDESAQAIQQPGALPPTPEGAFTGDQEVFPEGLPQAQLAPFRQQFTTPMGPEGPGVVGPGGGGSTGGGQVLGAQTGTGLDYSSEQLFNAAIQELQKGNSKGADQLMQMADMAAGLEQQQFERGKAGGSGGMSADQRKAVSQADNALSVIDQVEQAYGIAGGAQGAVLGTGRNILGKVRADQAANYYQSQKQGYLSRIIRAFGEVGTLNEGDVQRAASLMPDLADTPENAQRKIQGLRELLGEVRQRAQGGQYGFTGNELPSEISNLFPAMGF